MPDKPKKLPLGWTVIQAGEQTTYLYDPFYAELQRAPEWVDAKGYMNPAALLKGEIGFITGPVFRSDEKF